MKPVLQLGIVMFLLGSYLTPVMACMVSDVSMNPEERACCHAMQSECGQMEMPPSHGCCQKTLPGAHDNALTTKIAPFHPFATITNLLTTFEWLNPTSLIAGSVGRLDHSPPTSPPAAISVLRI